MRRISARYAKPGEVLGRPVYDSQGYEVIEAGTRLNPNPPTDRDGRREDSGRG